MTGKIKIEIDMKTGTIKNIDIPPSIHLFNAIKTLHSATAVLLSQIKVKTAEPEKVVVPKVVGAK